MILYLYRKAKRDRRRNVGTSMLSCSSMLAGCVSGVFFLHIKPQQLKLAILKTTETILVYYLFISSLCNEVICRTQRIFGGTNLKKLFSVNPLLCVLPFSLPASIHLHLCLSVTVCPYLSDCLSSYLSKKGIHPRLSGFDLHGGLIFVNPRTSS